MAWCLLEFDLWGETPLSGLRLSGPTMACVIPLLGVVVENISHCPCDKRWLVWMIFVVTQRLLVSCSFSFSSTSVLDDFIIGGASVLDDFV